MFDAMVRALTTIAKDSTDQIRSEVAEFSNYLMYDLDLGQIAPIEKEIVQERLYQWQLQQEIVRSRLNSQVVILFCVLYSILQLKGGIGYYDSITILI